MQNKYKICQFFKCFLNGYLSISVSSIAQLSIYSPVSDSTLGIISFELRVLGSILIRGQGSLSRPIKRGQMSLCFPLQGFKKFIAGDKVIYIYMCLVRVILSFLTRRHKTYLNVTQTAQGVWSRPNKILMIKYRMNNIKHLVIKSIDTYTCINFVRNRICLGTDLNLHCRVFQQKDAMSCCRTSLKMVSLNIYLQKNDKQL